LMQHDIVIIGGGIVGLGTALKLQEQKPALKIALIEKESGVARHQTGHNSGVIHSGIYYKPGSLKAQNCIRGYHYMIDFCNKHGIKYDLCGKIIVATQEHELQPMENVYQRGIENGLTGMKKLQAGELKEYEPHVAGIAGIFVPQTGIIDYKEVSAKMADLFVKSSGEIFTSQKVEHIKYNGKLSEVITQDKTYTAKLVINCAGLYSDKVARLTRENVDVRIIPFRGEYYLLKKEKQGLVKNLIYPVPDPNFPFLGVHFTRMIHGEVEAGPNAVFAFKREGYKKTDISISETIESLTWPGFQKVMMKYWKTGMGEFYRSFSKAAFTKALQRLVPDVQEDDLEPAGSGV
ncbi:MAG: L-2-hydroxyglutarate oxidase, partial [Phycisphaerales bacterium]|nr:L-2-hydroxyglutarate oxidase [Phycisphaerales bacterium]